MNKNRLLGIELCRGISAYAVIVVHSGDETWGLPIEAGATGFRLLFYFAVPFFLALSFYFLTRRAIQPMEREDLTHFWRVRLQRLMLPYAIWTTIFFASRWLAFAVTQNLARLQLLTQDLLTVVLFGGASYHLYFLPLLLSGTTLLLWLPWLQRLRLSRGGLFLLAAASMMLYVAIDLSNNNFLLGQGLAFNRLWESVGLEISQYPILRILSVWGVWIIRCIPYLLISLCLHRYLPRLEKLNRTEILVMAAVTFAVANIANVLLPASLCEVISAYSLLLIGFVISNTPSLEPFRGAITSVGSCSFGIYIIHPFWMALSKGSLAALYPSLIESVSIASILLLSSLCFLGSWLTVYYCSKHRYVYRYLFSA